MKYLKYYSHFGLNFPVIESKDYNNYQLIFFSLYNHHLSIQEKLTIETDFGRINESWFSDLVDKSKRGVLAAKSKAGEILVDLAKKAKDILDFAKQLASKISDHVNDQFKNLSDKVKNYAMEGTEFFDIIVEFLNKKKKEKLKSQFNAITDLLNYITSGQMLDDLIKRLSEAFSSVLNTGINEGIKNLEDEFLFESEEAVKKSFLQRLGEKIMAHPPFSWIPNIEELMKKGISNLSRIIDKFFCWLTTGNNNGISQFSKAFYLLFQILELYVYYKIINKIEQFKKFIEDASGIEDLSNKIQDKIMSEVWGAVGINPDEIISNIKNSIKKIPYVGDILSILDSLVIAIGTYLALQPFLKKIIT